MIDGIGGGNGGGGDPFGNLSKMLDPLGLFGGIAKMFKTGDASEAAELGKTVLNQVGSFDQTAGGGADLGASQNSDPTSTMWAPSADLDKARNGYADGTKNQKQIDRIQDDRMQGSFKMTAQSPGSSATQSAQSSSTQSAQSSVTQSTQSSGNKLKVGSAMQGAVQGALGAVAPEQQKLAAQKAKNEKETDVLTTVSAHFATFDAQNNAIGDGKFDRGNLELLVTHPHASQRVKDAAAYLLANPVLLERLQVISGGGTGQVTAGAVAQYLMKLAAQENQPGAAPPPSTPPPASPPPGPPPAGTPPGGAGGGGGVDKTKGGSGTGGSCDTQPAAKTLEESLQNIGNSMDQKEQDLLKLMKTGSTGDIAIAQQELAKINQQYKQMYELIGNLRRTFHEMSMSSIGHIR